MKRPTVPKIILENPKLSKPSGIFSPGVKVPAGNLVFVSGQVPETPREKL